MESKATSETDRLAGFCAISTLLTEDNVDAEVLQTTTGTFVRLPLSEHIESGLHAITVHHVPEAGSIMSLKQEQREKEQLRVKSTLPLPYPTALPVNLCPSYILEAIPLVASFLDLELS